MIEASFAQQYGIRLRRENDMPWGEFATLLEGLNEKTPLGSIVFIRSTEDKDYIKAFSTDQMRLRNEWRNREARRRIEENPKKVEDDIKRLQAALQAAFSN